MDREFAAKVSRKDGRKSYLVVASEVEVLAIIDEGAPERSHCLMDSGMYNRELEPGLGRINMIRQGEEVRVGEKACFSSNGSWFFWLKLLGGSGWSKCPLIIREANAKNNRLSVAEFLPVEMPCR